MAHSFDDVVLEFFSDAGVSETQRPRAACFAVAGPVDNNRVAFTNRCVRCLPPCLPRAGCRWRTGVCEQLLHCAGGC